MIDLRHQLAVLANRMSWQEIKASLAQRWAMQVKPGKKIEDLDLFGPLSVVAGGGVSNAGRPRLSTRLMVALLYLKHPFNESDEVVIQRWDEPPLGNTFRATNISSTSGRATRRNWGGFAKLWVKKA
jgi:IS5 family transposase